MYETKAPFLASPDDLAVRLKLPADNPKLLLALRRASDRFRDAVNHPVHLVENDTVYLNGSGTRTLFLPTAPVTNIAEVSINGVRVTGHETSRRRGFLRRATCWPDGVENVKVIYSHGYATIPGSIQDAVLEQAEMRAKANAGVQQETAGAKSLTWGVQATIGVTKTWTDAVLKYQLNQGDRS